MVPTPDRLSFGVMSGGPASDVEYLESLPIESLWVGGHVASPNPSPEAMVALAWLAAQRNVCVSAPPSCSSRCTRPRSSPSRSPTSIAPPAAA